ncbi:MAG TPA: iron transporter [Lachnospiraceae bacterium]|nr:iron transporter [Lachnospiraceae bacterium]
MKKKKMAVTVIVLLAALLGGCGDRGDMQEPDSVVDVEALTEENQGEVEESGSETLPEASKEEIFKDSEISESERSKAELADGIYTADFTTDSSMFRVNETCEGKGTLTVENGEMTIHISLESKKIINLSPGLAEDAEKEGAKLLMPTEDTVTYSDGLTEEVYGFDVPVPYLGEEFDLALIGTKGKWYDHKVSVSNPVLSEENVQTGSADTKNKCAKSKYAKSKYALEDGTYSMEMAFEGGSGKAKILSPVEMTVTDGQAIATLQWSSPNYDYMVVDGEKYLPVNTEGDSVFEVPVLMFDEPMAVIGDTVAMSTPHEVEYTLTFHSDTAEKR